MNRNIIHTLWTAALLLTACTQEEFPLPGTGDAVPLSVTVTDGGYASTDNAATRAAENGYRTEFTDGDECGLYIVRGRTVVYDNVKLTATAGAGGSLTWQPSAGVTLAGGLADEQYFLYYPYQSDMSDKTDASATDADGFFAPLVSGWQPAADQSTYAAYTASDLMTAQGTAARADGTLSLFFSMTHRMAMAVIEMPKTVYTFTDNTDGAIPNCTVVAAADFTGSGTKPCRMVDGTYRCIVIPASSTATRIIGCYDDGKKEFAITPNGITDSSYKTYKIDGVPQTEKQATLQIGDYFCKGSDDNWYIIPHEATPDGNVIGIVFHAGQHGTDQSDYTPTGIGQQKCHGYAVALTDVHNDDSDHLSWELGPDQQFNQIVGVSTSTDDWNGYSNSLKFYEFVKNNKGWEMKHFPAALACETYGDRKTDQNGAPANGKYDWQQPLAAPGNTSGWFLPSCGQLKYLYQNGSLLSNRMTEIQNSTPTDCNYKGNIKWFSTSRSYWSSTEDSRYPNCAWDVSFSNGNGDYNDKNYTRVVRAVLAF